ncbi:MAG: reverse transcriptase family protein [Myxococcales bacterium]|nr:reverse transcriptase family protein [Myxococcales bacterium]MDP3503782.1 reverse transcriptase family protein [Myxococcales bacterium]
MNPVEAILELERLKATRPVDLAAVARVLEGVDGLAEEDIVGTFAFELLDPGAVFTLLRSREPAERVAAVELAGRLGRLHAGSFLRHAIKDPDPRVANRASAHFTRLRLPEVGLPLHRPSYLPAFFKQPWSVAGWRFGQRRYDPRKFPVRASQLTSARRAEALVGVPLSSLPSLRRYAEFTVPKRRGGVRSLAAPHPALKQVQRRLVDALLGSLPVHRASTAFSNGSSVVTNAAAHVGRAMVIKLDLQDFFPSIHEERVRGLLLALGADREVADAFARLTTYRPRLASGALSTVAVLPQGAPTSPAIANLIARRLDARLAGLSKKWKANYTRYADDLTFSFAEEPRQVGRFLWWANAICQQEGFVENASKRRVMRATGRQQVTGLVVNQRVTLPRHVRRSFKAIVHNCERHGVASQARGRPDFEQWLLGFAAWAAVAQPDVGVDWLRRVKQVLGR